MRALLALLAMATGSALATTYTVPFSGWTAQDERTWSADSGVCILREDQYDRNFPAFATREEAAKFTDKLLKALYAQKLQQVVAQPVERAGQWGVLASYHYDVEGTTHVVTQLYLSSGGKLRTFTGSSPSGAVDSCVVDMRTFVRYLAN